MFCQWNMAPPKGLGDLVWNGRADLVRGVGSVCRSALEAIRWNAVATVRGV